MFTMPFNVDQAECVQAANQLIHDCGLSGFHWTSLQFNKNTVACEHTDKHNRGLSLVIILGDFTGGSLCVPSRSIVTSPNIHPVGIIIDGTEYHRSTQFVGTRYSIVAFMHTSYDELSLKQREKLTQLDFGLPLHDTVHPSPALNGHGGGNVGDQESLHPLVHPVFRDSCLLNVGVNIVSTTSGGDVHRVQGLQHDLSTAERVSTSLECSLPNAASDVCTAITRTSWFIDAVDTEQHVLNDIHSDTRSSHDASLDT